MNEDILKRIKVMMLEAADEGFNGGIIVCLCVLQRFDEPTIAQEIVSANGGIKAIEKNVSSDNQMDVDMLEWLGGNNVK